MSFDDWFIEKMEIEGLEESMRPGKLSKGGFLGEHEKLEDVLKADDETVQRLGLTHKKIAARLQYFIEAVACPTRSGVLVDGKYLVGGEEYWGGQGCPWQDGGEFMPNSYMDLYVVNQQTGERLEYPGGIVHLISIHRFYEGKESPYRVDPEKAARVLDIK